MPVAMHLTGPHSGGELRDVHPDLGGRIEPNVVARHEEKGNRRGAILEHLAQVAQRLAQPVGGNRIGLIRPEQGGERFSTVGPIALDDEVGEERPDQVALEAGDRLVVQSDLDAAEQAERESRPAPFVLTGVRHFTSPSEPCSGPVARNDWSPFGASIAPGPRLAT